MAHIVILGAGVVGLSTAVCIQGRLPVSKVTVMADKFFQETTSHGAGGIFRPVPSKFPMTDKEDIRRWLSTSWKHLSNLAWSPEGGVAGVTVISGYHLWNDEQSMELPTTKEFATDFRFLTEEELKKFPVKYKHGFFCSTLLCECRRYLPYLAEKFKSRGGAFIRRHVKSLDELTQDYDVIVDCAALGNRELLGDKSVYPVRGHLIRVKAPWLKHYIYTENDCHLIPGIDDIIIGCTRQSGDMDTTPREVDHVAIWERAQSIYPPLKSANPESVTSWVGLRPYRPSLRLEKEYLQNGTKTIPVIYNYGHGAEGVGLSWGTATEAAELVTEAVELLHLPPPSRL